MAETKTQDIDSMQKPITDTPPPYSSEPTTSAPVTYAPVAMTHAPVGVVGTNVGVVGTNVGNVGVVGVNVGRGTTMIPVVIAQQMSPKPMMMTCKSCNVDITTRVDSKPSLKTHFFAALLCLMGCWCCVCIPYFTKSCLDGNHYCPNCNAYLGSYHTYA